MPEVTKSDALVEDTTTVEPDWVSIRVHKALEAAAMPDVISQGLMMEMRGQMAERRMTGGELSRLAQNLLGALETARKS